MEAAGEETASHEVEQETAHGISLGSNVAHWDDAPFFTEIDY